MCKGGHVYGGSGCVRVCGGAGVCMGMHVAGYVWGVCARRVCVCMMGCMCDGVCMRGGCVCERGCVCVAACV